MPLPDLCYFVSEPPTFEYRAGMFHITQCFGPNLKVERVMSPHNFMRALRAAAECARKHRFAGAEVVDFARRSEASVA